MKRRSANPNSWKSRMSAGGANRTNLQGAMTRLREPADSPLIPSSPHRYDGSDLMPTRRTNSFQPFNSRLQPHRSPTNYGGYGARLMPLPPPPFNSYIPPNSYYRRECSPEPILYDDKRRPIPRRGMFLNAKSSKVPPPPISEEHLLHAEAEVRKVVDRSHYNDQRDYLRTNNNPIRESIIQSIRNQGNPDIYRARESLQYDEYEEAGRPSRIRHHHSSYHQSQLPSFHSSHHPYYHTAQHPSQHLDLRYSKHSKYSRGDRGDRIAEYEEEEGDSDDECEVVQKPKKQQKKKRKLVTIEESEEDEEEEQVCPTRKVQEKHRNKHQHLAENEVRSSDEGSHDKSVVSNASKASKTSKSDRRTPIVNEERAPSRGSKSSKHSTPKPLSPLIGPYVKEPDFDDNWRNSLNFMCMPNGAGAGMLQRIGSTITPISLRDDSKNSYSQVAIMLLGKSLKNLNNPQKKRDDERPQSQLLNMSTSWARHRRSPRHTIVEDEFVPDTKNGDTSLLRDISRIQNPQNASTLQIDQTVFTIPRLFDVDVGISKNWVRRKPNQPKKKMPPPLHRSSPKSDDVFKSSEQISVPSTIKKASAHFGIYISDDDGEQEEEGDREKEEEEEEDQDEEEEEREQGEEPVTKELDVDEYIARGASQLDESYFPANPNLTYNPSPADAFEPPASRQEVNIESPTNSEKSPDNQVEYEIEISTTSNRSKEISSLQFNSRFMLSPSQKKKKAVEPLIEIDDETQKMFDQVFENSHEKSSAEKILF